MNRLQGAIVVFLKEMKDITRDRRSIVSMVLVPILVYPLMAMGFGAIISSQVQRVGSQQHEFTILPWPNDPMVTGLFSTVPQMQLVPPDSVASHLSRVAQEDPALDPASLATLFGSTPEDVPESTRAQIYYRAISGDALSVVVELPTDFTARIASGDSTPVRVFVDRTDIQSETAGEHLDDWLLGVRDSIVAMRLIEAGLDRRTLHPVRYDEVNIAPQAKRSGFFFASFLPYMLVILMLTGGMYPALDITAGEKERNTLETLLVAPVPRWSLAIGKFLAVFTAGMVTMLLSTLSMVITFKFGTAGFGDGEEALEMASAFSLSTESLLLVILLMIPTAVLFASLLIAISIAARSFKEGQSYITPLIFVAIFPAMVSMVPGIELNTAFAFVPIVNIALALKEVILRTHSLGMIALVFFATALYASFALFVATRLFERESTLFRT